MVGSFFTARSKVHFWRALPPGVVAVICAWLVWCAWTVDIDYYDGYDTVFNAQFFSALIPAYIPNRWPLLALLLSPVEWIKMHFNIPSMDVRWDHAVFAILHGIYLALSWHLVKRLAGRGRAACLAFLLIVPNVLFVNYAPFINHDIFPGLLLLAMLALSFSWTMLPTLSTGIGLLVLGTLAVLIKPLFAIFWLCVFAVVLMDGVRKKMLDRPMLLFIAGLVAASGGLFILIMGSVLTSSQLYLDVPFFFRPLRQITFVSGNYPEPQKLFPLWIYLANLPAAWGWAAATLLIPAFFLALKNGGRSAGLAAACLVGFIALHIVPLREVRYMAFLAPLTACIVTPLVRSLLKKSRRVLMGVLLLAIVDGTRVCVEAASYRHPFYRQSEARQFLAPLETLTGRAQRLLFINQPVLSFVAPNPSPFAGDRYHRFFHVAPHHIRFFYGVGRGPVIPIPREYNLIENLHPVFPSGSVVLLSSQVLVNDSRLKKTQSEFAESLQSLSVVETEGSRRKFRVLRRSRTVYIYEPLS